MRREVERDDARVRARARGRRRRRRDVPPPNGTTAMPRSSHDREHGEHLVVGGGRDHRVGRGLRIVEAAPQQVGRALAAEVQHPDARRRASRVASPTTAASARGRHRRAGRARARGAARRGTGCGLAGQQRRRGSPSRPAGRRAGSVPQASQSDRGRGDGHARAGGRGSGSTASSQAWRQYDTLCMVVTWPTASPTPRPRSSTRRSQRCSRTASAGRRHPTSHAAAASPARPSTATGPTRSRVFAALVTRELLAVLPAGRARARRPRRARRRCSSRPPTAIRRLPLVDRLRDTDPELFARYILDRLGTSQRAIHAELARAIARGPGRRASCARATRRSSPRWCCSSRSPRCSRRRSWRSGCPPSAWRAELAHALRGYLARADGRDDADPRPHAAPVRAASPRAARASSTRSPPTPPSTCSSIGGGVTGAGIALDAASRGLRTVLVERRDLAHGTSRWSSKLVHGGLRYLASGQVGDRARERVGAASAPDAHRAAPRRARWRRSCRCTRRGTCREAHTSASATASATACAASSARRTRCSARPGPIGRDETLRLAPALARRRAARRDARLGRPAHRRRAARRRRSPGRRPGTGHPSSPASRRSTADGDGALLRDALTGSEVRVRRARC